MRASFYEGSRTFRTGPISRPSRAADQALLRVQRAGICGTDLHIFQGHLDHRIPKGGIIGHETFAEVVEAPAGSGFEPGSRVVVEPIHSCGECRACKMGGYYLCYRLKIYGVELPGGMQDYWTVPAAPEGVTVAVSVTGLPPVCEPAERFDKEGIDKERIEEEGARKIDDEDSAAKIDKVWWLSLSK